MNSFIAIELNTFFQEYVKEKPITGKVALDQKLVTIIITFITTYAVVLLYQVACCVWDFLGKMVKKETYFINNKDNLVHVWVRDPGTLWSALNKYVPTLPRVTSSYEMVKKYNKTSFTVWNTGGEASAPWTISTGGAKFPHEEAASDKNGGLTTYYFVKFQNTNLLLEKYRHKEGNEFWHIFIEPKESNIEKIVHNFLQAAYNCHTNKDQPISDIGLYEVKEGQWKETIRIKTRSFDTIVGNKSKLIFKDVENFQNVYSDLYKTLDIPYKRGYLLWGHGGTGKTSCVRAVASYTRRPIYKLTFNENNLGDDEYKSLLAQTATDSIILLDDIDPQLLQEGGFIEKTKITIGDEDKKEKPIVVKCRVSYNTLLDALDGINSNNGRLTFITTNHPDKIGSALLRPGRIDMKCKMDYAEDNEIEEYFCLFYSYFKMDKEIILPHAQRFIKHLRALENPKITFAELQQYLVLYLDNIEKAVDSVSTMFKSGISLE